MTLAVDVRSCNAAVAGLGIAWQVAFLAIGRDPVRLRLMMIPAMLEKFIFVLTLAVLYVQGHLLLGQLAVAVPDFILGILFIVSFFKVADDR